MSHYLQQKKYNSEEIQEQYFDIQTETLWIITKSYGNWTLYNYTKNKMIKSANEVPILHKKIPNYF
jgi:hypothetical protein